MPIYHVDPFDAQDLRWLLRPADGISASLYIPTHAAQPEEQHADRLRLQNMLSDVQARLPDGMTAPQRQAFVAPAARLLDEGPFWRHLAQGLAIFLAEETSAVYRLPLTFDKQAVLDDRFYVLPLLPLLTENGRFYILALSQNDVRLFRGTPTGVAQVDLADTPTSLDAALAFDDPERRLQFHTSTGATADAGGRAAVHFGHMAVPDNKVDILRFFRQVDEGVQTALAGEESPLLLASVDYLQPLYREANSYAHLIDEGLVGNPETLSPAELQAQAWPLVAPHFAQARQAALAAYRQLAQTPRAASDLAEVLSAAHHGRVQTLLVSRGATAWGTFRPQDGTLHQGAPGAGDASELLNLAATETLRNSGEVYVVSPEEMPGETAVAAVFRY